MLINSRVILNKNGVLTDLTLPLSDYHSNTAVTHIDTGTDFLYVGSDLPFNHRYFMVSVENNQSATISIDLWSGDGWTPAIDILDDTINTGHPLGKSGIISWTPDPDKSSWSYDDTDEMPNSGLQSLKIKGLYWARLKWSDSLRSTMALQYIGHKFSEDADLYVEYPEFSSVNFKHAFKAAKSDWNEQHLLAAEYVIQDLRTINVIRQGDQILDWRRFKNASIHKTAEIIFKAFGDDYSDNLVQAKRDYKDALQQKYYNVDKDENATLTDQEKLAATEFLTR